MRSDISVIWIVSNARTGSMWTTNVVRELLRSEGTVTLPREQIAGGEEAILAYGVNHVDRQLAGVSVLKTHKPVPELPRSVGIVTRRDVRDATVSYMRFMRAPFEQGLRFAERCLQRTPDVLFPSGRYLEVDYASISDSPVEVIDTIANYLGVIGVSAEKVSTRFSKDAVRARIDTADAYVRAQASVGKPIEGERIVVAGPGNWRAMDPDTGFQTGHVSDYREGDWQRLLSPTEQGEIQRLILRYGHHDA